MLKIFKVMISLDGHSNKILKSSFFFLSHKKNQDKVSSLCKICKNNYYIVYEYSKDDKVFKFLGEKNNKDKEWKGKMGTKRFYI